MTNAAPPPTDTAPMGARQTAWVTALYTGFAALLNLPRLGTLFHGREPTFGTYMGPAVNNFHKFGFWEMHGVPVIAYQETLEQAESYVNHPPGIYWAMSLFGPEEWGIRLPGALAGLLAALFLQRLLFHRFGLLPSVFGGLLFLTVPNVVIYSRANFENFVLAAGFAMQLGLPRAGIRATRAGWALLAIGALAGPWTDWGFAFCCMGALPLCISTRPRGMTRLAVASAIVLASLGSVFVWREWCADIFPRPTTHNLSIRDMVGRYAFVSRGFGDFLRERWVGGSGCLSAPMIFLMIGGFVPAAVRDLRLALSLLLTCTPTLIVFSAHADASFYTFLVPLASLAWATTLFHAARLHQRLPMGIGIAVLAICCIWTETVDRYSQSPFYHDFAQTLNRAADDDTYWVTHNMNVAFAYYLESPTILPGGLPEPTLGALLEDPAALRSSVQDPKLGARFLWLIRHGTPPNPVLAEKLTKYPKTRQPQLETTIYLVNGTSFTFDEAWLVTLWEPTE